LKAKTMKHLLDDERVIRIQDIMRDQMGIVQPAQHMEMIQVDNDTIAVQVKWPIGIDKRAADQRILGTGKYKLVIADGLDPYTSAYIISVRLGKKDP